MAVVSHEGVAGGAGMRPSQVIGKMGKSGGIAVSSASRLAAVSFGAATKEESMSEHRQLCATHPDVDYQHEWGCPRCLSELRAEHADLVLVVEKLLAGARGHYTSCSVWRGKKRTPCTCGADEARELLLKIRGEG